MRGVNVELSGRISDIAMGKKAEILKILQGVSVEDALDSLNIWAVGQGGTLINTSDGGMTWDSIPNGMTKSLYTVEFINADTGWHWTISHPSFY